MVRHGLDLLFALAGLRYPPDAGGVAAFAQRFGDDAAFTPQHATLYLRLVGLARQAERAYWVTGRDDDRRLRADVELEEASGFLRGLQQRLETILTSDADRARTRTRRLQVLGAGGALFALLVTSAWFFMHPEEPIRDLSVITSPGAILGEYFEGETLDRKVFERNDKAIAIGVEKGPGASILPSDHFSVRWSGYIRLDAPGKWDLCGKADDGVRIHFNDRLVVDAWRHDEGRTLCASLRVRPGWYPLTVEYREDTGRAELSLLRGPPRRALQVIPPATLCCAKPPEQLLTPQEVAPRSAPPGPGPAPGG
jgi:hypothetical protein